jgi:hypothetical protein
MGVLRNPAIEVTGTHLYSIRVNQMYHARGGDARGRPLQIGVFDHANMHRSNARRFLDTSPLGIFMRMH